MPIDRKACLDRLKKFDFPGLFTQELGWDWHKGSIEIKLPTATFTAVAVAQKRGFVAYHVTVPDGVRLDSPLLRKIEHQITRSTRENLIVYSDPNQQQQIWHWVRRYPGKPIASRIHRFHPATQAGDLLLQKLEPLFVSLDEEDSINLVEVARRVRKSFDVEQVTKKFFEQFQKEHGAFLKFIDGIAESSDREWYASVMLNRLMFVYFIQRKGFLDGDPKYLRKRLDRCQHEKGKDKFYSFYRYFLLRLFHEGFGKRPKERAIDLEKLLGRIPYLNGGFFEQHEIERRYPTDIQIPDKAFERIFDYFDQYEWHLDERPLKAGNEINPDVLGFIFEKYINQKQMGAYYTKEDITEYISKNTVIPFLFDAARTKCKVAFEAGTSRREEAHSQSTTPTHTVWDLLSANPDHYIYAAVRHGAHLSLPDDIAAGMGDVSKRTNWNKSAPPEFALPTEIWREVVARRQRCDELRRKLQAGEVRDINDLITLNLDIRQFAQDVIEQSEGPELLRAFWHAIAGGPEARGVTILDPTCGSGAFLFAALNILEPLYEACLDRMEQFVEDEAAKHAGASGFQGAKLKTTERGILLLPHKKFEDFSLVLDRVEAHPNRRYFIFKSIILTNLFGVDIMEEAVEICKLRLFLKLAAQVDPDSAKENLGIEPLPDIDFNIRAGNTLVGYATAPEVRKCMTQFGDGQMRLGVEDELQSFTRFTDKLQIVDAAFRSFRQQQTELGGVVTPKDKADLEKRLEGLEAELNRYLATDYGVKPTEKAFQHWLKSHQPFHWFVEFYGIMNSGGFDVIIGNPPYVVNTPEKVGYQIRESHFATFPSKNLYAFVFERSLQLARQNASLAMIIQLTALSAEKMSSLQDLLLNRGMLLASAFPRRPESIFDGVEMPVAILTSRVSSATLHTTRVNRFYTEERPTALALMGYATHDFRIHGHRIAKIGLSIGVGIYRKIKSQKAVLGSLTSAASKDVLYYQEACRYWVKACVGLPFFRRDGERMPPPHGRILNFRDAGSCAFAGCLVNSTLFYWFYSAFSDCEHINDGLIRDFGIPPESKLTDWIVLEKRLAESQKRNARRKIITTKQGHKIEYDEMDAPRSKPILDEIDTVLAALYGFTAEELDFIINYDIKYRLGRDAGAEEEA